MKNRIRRLGGGRKKRVETDDELIREVEKVVADDIGGCPSADVEWTYLTISEVQRVLEKEYQRIVSWPVLKDIFKHLRDGRRSLFKQEVMKKEDVNRDAQFNNISKFRNYLLGS